MQNTLLIKAEKQLGNGKKQNEHRNNRTMNMEHLLAATNKVVELHNENVQLHTELADAKCKLAKYQNDSGDDSLYNVRRLRSELAEAIKQRDALAEALRDIVKSIDPYEMYKTAKRALEIFESTRINKPTTHHEEWGDEQSTEGDEF